MSKSNLKALFLSLFARRSKRVRDKSSRGLAATESPQAGAAARSRIEPAGSDQKASSGRAEARSRIGDRPAEELAGSPEGWLAKRSSGPPAHWVERVRQGAPELLQDMESNKAGATAAPQPPGEGQRRPTIPAPPRLQRSAIAPPLRLQRPAIAPRSIWEPEQSGRGAGYAPIDGRGRLEPQKQEPPAPSFSVDTQRRETELSGRHGPAPPVPTQIYAPQARRELAGGRTTGSPQISSQSGKDGRTRAVAPPGLREWVDSIPVVLPPANSHRPSGTKTHNPTCVDSNGLVQSSANSDVTPDHDVIHRETRRDPVSHERLAFNSGYRQVSGRKEEVTKPIEPPAAHDRRATSYDIPADRWPALFEASSDDYFDDAIDVWREANHDRRLAGEQAGSLWSE